MEVQGLFAPIRAELDAVEQLLLRNATDSPVPLISRVGEHVLSGGGKRFRPALTLLCSRICGTEPSQSIPLAASVELVHNATLLHDDIVDEGTVRRGRPAAHRLWGDSAGVLAANFHFSTAFSLILRAGGLVCLEAMNRALHAIVEGELLQFLRLGQEVDEAGYRLIIDRKTARLIATACELGALAGREPERAGLLSRFGLELGMAFQMMDDVLDYTAREETLGKRVGTDFREGKFTLPLIFTLTSCGPEENRELREILRQEPEIRESQFAWACALIDRCGGFDYTRRSAGRHLARALEELRRLPSNPAREALAGLSRLVMERKR